MPHGNNPRQSYCMPPWDVFSIPFTQRTTMYLLLSGSVCTSFITPLSVDHHVSHMTDKSSLEIPPGHIRTQPLSPLLSYLHTTPAAHFSQITLCLSPTLAFLLSALLPFHQSTSTKHKVLIYHSLKHWRTERRKREKEGGRREGGKRRTGEFLTYSTQFDIPPFPACPTRSNEHGLVPAFLALCCLR